MAAGKGILALLAAPKKGGGSEPPPAMGDDEMGGGDEVADALGEMFRLLKAGDNAGAATEFRRAKAACDDGGDEYEDEEADDEMEM